MAKGSDITLTVGGTKLRLEDYFAPIAEAAKLLPEKLWQVGDIVSRDGTDEHVILEIGEVGDTFLVRCTKAPSQPWTAVGDEESNLPFRYEFVRRGTENDE